MKITIACLILCLLSFNGMGTEWDMQKLKKEISASQQALQDSKSTFVQEYLREAQRCHQLKDFNASITAVRKGLYLDPQNRELLVLWGADLIELGAYNRAKQVLKRLVNLYPDYFAGWKCLYRCYVKTSDLDGQKVALKKLYILATNKEERKIYFEKLVDLLGKTSDLDGQCVVLKKMYALAESKKEQDYYFELLVKLLWRSQEGRTTTDVIRDFVGAQLRSLCSINLKGKIDETSIEEAIAVLNLIEEMKKQAPCIGEYYADFIEELYSAVHLFNLGYESIAVERLRDLLSQRCPALSS